MARVWTKTCWTRCRKGKSTSRISRIRPRPPKTAAGSASDTDVNHQIAVVDTPTEESASAADTAVSGFGGTMKTAMYPLSLAMTICGSMILGAFTTGEVLGRCLTASPRRMVLMGLQRLLTLGGFALVVCVGYLVLSIGLMMAAGLDSLHLSVGEC